MKKNYDFMQEMEPKDYFLRVEAYPFDFGSNCFVDFYDIDEMIFFCEERNIDINNSEKVFIVTWNS